MSNKLFVLVVILLFFVAFIVVSLDRDDTPGDKISQMFPRAGASATPSVEVQVSESQKFEANEFVTVAMLELHGKDKELLFRQLASRRASVFEQMKGLDVQEGDIEQNTVEMRKEWAYEKGERSLTGYVVSQSFAIRASSRAASASVIASLSAELDVEILHTSASLKNKAEFEKEIIHAAGKKALEKAANYAESVGGKLGMVLSVGGDSYGSGIVRSARLSKGVAAYSLDGAHADLSAVADSVEISATVHLVAELLQ